MARYSAEGGKAVMPIERFGMLALGVNDKGVNRHLGTQEARRPISSPEIEGQWQVSPGWQQARMDSEEDA